MLLGIKFTLRWDSIYSKLVRCTGEYEESQNIKDDKISTIRPIARAREALYLSSCPDSLAEG